MKNEDNRKENKQEIENELDQLPFYDLTELGNAKRFVEYTDGQYLFLSDTKEWVAYNDKTSLWEKDVSGRHRDAKEIILKGIKLECELLDEKLEKMVGPNYLIKGTEERKYKDQIEQELKIANNWYKKSQSLSTINNSFSLAQDERKCNDLSTNFNTKPHMIGTSNGVLNLKTKRLVQNDKKYKVSRKVNVKYNPDASYDEWVDTLYTYTQGNKEIVQFLKLYFGSCLTGFSPDKLVILYGSLGANGKSTVVDVIKKIMGEYVISSSLNNLMGDRNKSKVEYYIAQLQFKRLILLNEVGSNEVAMADDIMKQLVDSGEVTGRHPGGKPFDIVPQWGIVMTVNHIPSFSADASVWRRLIIVPFEYVIPEEQRNRNFVNDITERCGEGIFKWLVEGAAEYLETGLVVPQSLKEHTAEYKDENNPLKNFIKERYMRDEHPRYKITLTKFREDYKEWCKSEGLSRSPSNKKLKLELTELSQNDTEMKHVKVSRSSGNINYVYGVRLKSQQEIIDGSREFHIVKK